MFSTNTVIKIYFWHLKLAEDLPQLLMVTLNTRGKENAILSPFPWNEIYKEFHKRKK